MKAKIAQIFSIGNNDIRGYLLSTASYLTKATWIGWVGLISCAGQGMKYQITSMLKCLQVEKDYHYCDSAMVPENCILTYSESHYLKKDKIFFAGEGFVDSVWVFKPEGIVVYVREGINNDPLLQDASDWNIKGHLQFKGDSITHPVRAKIKEQTSELIYASAESEGQSWLYVFAYE